MHDRDRDGDEQSLGNVTNEAWCVGLVIMKESKSCQVNVVGGSCLFGCRCLLPEASPTTALASKFLTQPQDTTRDLTGNDLLRELVVTGLN